jgi:hypothetical protein
MHMVLKTTMSHTTGFTLHGVGVGSSFRLWHG